MTIEAFLKTISWQRGRVTWVVLILTGLFYLMGWLFPKEAADWFLFQQTAFQGDYWRFLTPSLFHQTFGHFFENTCWLIFLCYQCEYYFGAIRTLLIIGLLAIVSNLSNYVLTDVSSVGFSAIAVGIGAFLWRRQLTYQEVYFFPVAEKVILFFGNLILLGVSLLQLYALFPAVTSKISAACEFLSGPPCDRIAHIAHLSAWIVGWMLGEIPLFQWRSSKI